MTIMKNTALLTILLSVALPAACAEQKSEIESGPFISATFVSQWPKNTCTYKGIAVRLDYGKDTSDIKDPHEREFRSGVIFDTDLLRVSAGWTDAALKLQGIPFDMAHGLNPEIAKGAQVFGTRPGPGWARDGAFTDPRPVPYGPLPADWAKYKGLYRSGSKIIFSYSVGKCDVLETHALENGVFYREFTMAPSAVPMELMVCETESSKSAKVNSRDSCH